MRDCCLKYPWYCDACDVEVWNQEELCWTCPFDDVVPKVSLLETEHIHSEVKNE